MAGRSTFEERTQKHFERSFNGNATTATLTGNDKVRVPCACPQ